MKAVKAAASLVEWAVIPPGVGYTGLVPEHIYALNLFSYSNFGSLPYICTGQLEKHSSLQRKVRVQLWVPPGLSGIHLVHT